MDKTNNKLQKFILNHIQHYDHKKYWKMRDYVIDSTKKNKIKKYMYLIKVKKIDAYHNASMGTNINCGAYFHSTPFFPHGLNGIFIAHEANIGKNCVIYQQVTIGKKNETGGAPMIGNNCIIYPGAKIFGEVTIGDNCVIGANAVVNKSFPNNCIIGGVPARLLRRKNERN